MVSLRRQVNSPVLADSIARPLRIWLDFGLNPLPSATVIFDLIYLPLEGKMSLSLLLSGTL